MGGFAHISNGQEHWECGARIPHSRHDLAYAALVLSGSYEECGSRGRFRVRAGDVLLHEAFDAHLNCFQSRGAQILNLVLADMPAGSGIGRVANLDAISRAAERDIAEAGIQLRAQLRNIQHVSYGIFWPDELAAIYSLIPIAVLTTGHARIVLQRKRSRADSAKCLASPRRRFAPKCARAAR